MIKKYIWLIVVLILVILTSFFCIKSQQLNPEEIVRNSELGKKNFSLPVKEVISPKHKIKAYLLEDKTNPIVQMSFVFSYAGKVAEKKGQEGLAKLTSSVQSMGGGDVDFQEFSKVLENHAISLNFSVNQDDYKGQLLTTKEHAPKAFELLKMSLNAPRFDKEDIFLCQKEMIFLLKSEETNPESKHSLKAQEVLFGKHPYGRNPLGTEENIKKFTKQDMQDFIKQNLGLSNLYVAVSGDMNTQEVSTMLDDVFGSLPPQGATDKTAEVMPDFTQDDVYINEDIPQNISIIAARGTQRKAKDFYPLFLANYVLGSSGLSSRINLQAREKEGLTYGVYTYLDMDDKSSLISGGFSASAQNFARVIAIIKEEWKKIGERGISQKELDEAKSYMLASNNLRFADISVLSNMLLFMQQEELGIDFLQKRNHYIQEVRLEEVNEAAKRYFTPDNLLFINIGKFSNQQEK